MIELIAIYIVCGCIAGVLAGLLGVGGGIVIVPMLSYVFTRSGFPPDIVQHMAVATSSASIIFTSFASLRAHRKAGAVFWKAFKMLLPGVFLGTLGGAFIARFLSSKSLTIFFICFLYIVATQMLLNFKPKAERQLPAAPATAGVGGIIGIISSLVGVAGGTITVPFLSWCNINTHMAIGTSAALGVPIAIFSTVGQVISGSLADVARPAWSLGFVYLPAVVALIIPSMLCAPIGAKIAHKLPVGTLKRIFAFFLLITATKMLIGIL